MKVNSQVLVIIGLAMASCSPKLAVHATQPSATPTEKVAETSVPG